MIWATVSSQSCFCRLYLASPSLAAKIPGPFSVWGYQWSCCIRHLKDMFSFLLGKMWQWNWQVLCKAYASLNMNVPKFFSKSLCHTHPHAQLLSRVWVFATAWTVVHQAPLSMGFSRWEYWSGLPCCPPGDLPDPGMKPVSLVFPALAFFTSEPSRKPTYYTWS